MGLSPHKLAAFRCFTIVTLLLFFILFTTLRGLPRWSQLDLHRWTDASRQTWHLDDGISHMVDTSSVFRGTVDKAQIVGLGESQNVQAVYDHSPHKPMADIDHVIEGEPQFELVLSYFDAERRFVKTYVDKIRDIPYIKRLGLKLTIYCKNPEVDTDALQHATGADKVVLLPNVGRESQTMLHHIITSYDNPSKFTMFSQADPEWVIEPDGSIEFGFKRKLSKDLRPNTGYLGLNSWNELCTCGNCGSRGRFPLQITIYNMLEQRVCNGENWNSLFSQFIVSKQRFLSRPLKAYKWLHTMISAPAENWLHAELQPDSIKAQYMPNGSTMENPLLGHTLERSWTTLFNCSHANRINDQNLGTVNEKEAHCWDWNIEHEGIVGQPQHWPGFEDIDAAWEREEAAYAGPPDPQEWADAKAERTEALAKQRIKEQDIE